MAKKKVYDDDDGRVIANMNVDGMPWSMRDVMSRRKKSDEKLQSSQDFSDLTKEETRELVKGAMKAGLLIGGVFLVGAFLFILFCLFIWFR
ncbi:MAG: hypothetical protein IJE26_03110 [Oscillospiraceae bacterium]|nr:hypothetical protein [Oscillospiraceae bacterium]MBQ2895678.1 hypothetical protein [Oscillospiraceae bacterium]MBQ3533128.1 hypothetical protein [Oscillospiraceae bacterium]